MKTNKFWLGALALLATGVMASCSNEEPAVNPDNGTEQSGSKYMTVRISNVGNAGTRGLAEQVPAEIENAVGDEAKISAEDLRFYFFDENYAPFYLIQTQVDGTVSRTNMVQPTTISHEIDKYGNETYTNGVLVLGKTDTPYLGKTPKFVVCAANLTENQFNRLAGKNMNDMYNDCEMQKTVNGIVDGDDSNATLDWTKFRMASSTYVNEEYADPTLPEGQTRKAKVIASEIFDKGDKKNIFDNADDAKATPVHIYLERLASKVRVTGIDTYSVMKKDADGELSEQEFTLLGADGSETKKTLKVELTGWRLANRATKAKLFKDVSADGDYFANWNDPFNHRCYWALTPADPTLINTSWNIYDANQFALTNYDDKKATENIMYTYPNTTPKSIATTASDRSKESTGVVVRAIVKDSDGNVVELVRWNGEYFLMSEFRKIVVAKYNSTPGIEDEATVDDVVFVKKDNSDGKHPNQYVARCKAVTYNGSYDDLQVWTGGQTSYYVNIQHATTKSGEPLFGLVRNHIYQLDLNNVVGLGVPGNDKTDPEDPTESYLACKILVLNWRVINNSVVLE